MFIRSMTVVLCLLAAHAAYADTDADKAAIIQRLQRWTAAFNARDDASACDLFAPDLIATTPDGPDRGRDALCAGLRAVQATPGLQLHYDNPDVQEIIVSGNIALVRLVWTLTARKGSDQDVTTEPGMDIFRRQPDGRWSIARFIAFTTRPNNTLQP